MKAIKKILVSSLCAFLALDVFSQGISDNMMKAEALLLSGKTDDAITLLSEAISVKVDHRLYLKRAEAHLMKADYSGAINDFNEANKLSPSCGEFGLARVYALKGDVQTSLYHLENNLKSELKKSEKYILLDPSFRKVENSKEWRAFWRTERYSGLEKKVSELEFYTSTGKSEDALFILNEIRSGYPYSDEVPYSEALYFVSIGRYSEALKKIVPLAEKHQGNERFLRLLARAQEGISNSAGASSTYTRLLDSGISDAGVLISRAKSYQATGEDDKALADIEQYLSIYPGDVEALRIAGKLHTKTGDNLRAIQTFSENIKLHPGNAELYADRAGSYLVAKSWEWAVNDYSMSLDLRPDNHEVWLNKGIALLNLGRTTEACHDFRKALSLGNRRASELISRNCIK